MSRTIVNLLMILVIVKNSSLRKYGFPDFSLDFVSDFQPSTLTLSSSFTPTQTPRVFINFPSQSQIREWIKKADALSILSIVKSLSVDDYYQCEKKVLYLNRVLAEINQSIKDKMMKCSQLTNLIKETQNYFQNLSKQKKQRQNSNSKLSEEFFAKFIVGLQNIDKQYKEVILKVSPKQFQIKSLQEEMHNFYKSLQVEKHILVFQRKQLKQTEHYIKNVQEKISEVYEIRESLQQSLSRSSQKIKNNEGRISKIRKLIQHYEQDIFHSRNRLDQLKKMSLSFQVHLDRLRFDVNRRKLRQRQIKNQIMIHKDTAFDLKKHLPMKDFNQAQFMIQKLKYLTKNAERQIDRHFYDCFANGCLKVAKRDNKTVFVIRGQLLFQSYMKKLYGQDAQIPFIKGEIYFNKVDIFSQAWKSNFGYPFSDKSLSNNFHCLRPSVLQKGFGKIISINKDSIMIKNFDKKQLLFKLSSCTRLESMKKLPYNGQTLYWSGQFAGKYYHLYTGSCI